MIKAILFDLDGTLIPMPPEVWTDEMIKLTAAIGAKHGYDPKLFVMATVKAGIQTLDANTTNKTGIELYEEVYKQYGINNHDDIYNSYEEAYNSEDFQKLKSKLLPLSVDVKSELAKLRDLGLKLVIATNPIQSKTSIFNRLKWIDMNECDFDLVTHYQNSTRTKASPEYYTEIIGKLGIKPEETLMVGNDVAQDIESALKAGLHVHLVTDHVIKNGDKNISHISQSSIKDFFSVELSRFLSKAI